MTRKKTGCRDLATVDQPTAPAVGDDPWAEDGIAEKHRQIASEAKARVLARPRRPFIKMKTDDGKRNMIVGGEKNAVFDSILLHEVSGSGSTAFAHNLLDRVAELVPLSGDDEADGNRLSAAFAMIAAIEPRDEIEATMALHLVAANEAVLSNFKLSRRNAELPEFSQRFSTMANKAMRSFALHVEAIEKLRRGGVQEVRHVTIDNRGGQAVIADTVNNGGRV